MPDSIRLDARSATACDMTVWGDRVQLAWTGRDYRLRLGSTFGLTPLEGERKLRYTSYRERSTSDSSPMNTTVMPPSVAGAGDRLLLAWTASNWSVWLVAADPSSDFHAIPVKERSWLPSVVVPVGGDRSILSWIGTDRRINLLELKGERPERSIRLDNAKSDHRPAVCRHGHGLTVAWTGGDRRVNVLGVESGRPGRQDILRDAKTGAEPRHQQPPRPPLPGLDRGRSPGQPPLPGRRRAPGPPGRREERPRPVPVQLPGRPAPGLDGQRRPRQPPPPGGLTSLSTGSAPPSSSSLAAVTVGA
jgi:hypothetical protein